MSGSQSELGPTSIYSYIYEALLGADFCHGAGNDKANKAKPLSWREVCLKCPVSRLKDDGGKVVCTSSSQRLCCAPVSHSWRWSSQWLAFHPLSGSGSALSQQIPRPQFLSYCPQPHGPFAATQGLRPQTAQALVTLESLCCLLPFAWSLVLKNKTQ